MKAKTCETCPWLKEANPAALSKDDAAFMVKVAAYSTGPVGCHCQKDDKTIRHSTDEPQDKCRGALISVRGGDDTVMSLDEMEAHYTQDWATEWPNLQVSEVRGEQGS